MYRIKADKLADNAFIYWQRKFYPGKPFPPFKDYEEWMKTSFGATDNGGDYIYFKTKEDKFYFQTVFKTNKCLVDIRVES